MIPLPRFLMKEDPFTPKVEQSLMERYKQKTTKNMLKKAIQYENYIKICKNNNEKLSSYRKANDNELAGAIRRQETRMFIVPQTLSNKGSSAQLHAGFNISQQLGKATCSPAKEFDIAMYLSDDD